MEADGRMATLPKKEQLLLRKELGKLQANLNGVRDMRELPGGASSSSTPSARTSRSPRRAACSIPIIGLVDTNADPDEVDYVIPANDDAIRSVGLMCRVIADAVIDGRGGIQDVVPRGRVRRTDARRRRRPRPPPRPSASRPSAARAARRGRRRGCRSRRRGRRRGAAEAPAAEPAAAE